MSAFSQYTIVEAISELENWTHSRIDQFVLQFGLDPDYPEKDHISKQDKTNTISRYLIDHPNEIGPSGSDLTFEVIDRIVSKIEQQPVDDDWVVSDDHSRSISQSLESALSRDGYAVRDEELVRLVPEKANLKEHESELEQLLEKFDMDTAKGHLDQAFSAYSRGEWASSNSQLRTFVESLFEAIADELGIPEQARSHQRKEKLAQLSPPFLDPSLNEWKVGDNGGFVQGFWRRLHPEGSHPGLSDEEDSTFRLHMTLIVSHHYLRRLSNR